MLSAGGLLLACSAPQAHDGGGTNQPPTVVLTAPVTSAALPLLTAASVTAQASDEDGSVALVQFFDGAALIGEVASAPYSISWTPQTPGNHLLTARAIDNDDADATSASVSVTVVNAAPTVSLTAPSNGSNALVGAQLALAATAADPDGNVVEVRFYDGATQIGVDATAPYQASWTAAGLGAHQLTARAIDNHGLEGSSAAVAVTVSNPNAAPTVTLTSPAGNSNVLVGAQVALAATAADPDGNVAEVRFYDGATQIGVDAAAPYQATWTAAGIGVHGLTAHAIDNLGLETVSSAVSVTVSNAPNVAPVGVISLPGSTLTYKAKDTIQFSGSATDAEDGPLGAGSLSWWVTFHHDTHTHPFLPVTPGGAGSLVVPDSGHTESNVWLRFYLRAIDSQGAADTTYVDVFPRTILLTITTQRPGLQITLDGQPHTAPYTVTGVIGVIRSLGVISPQVLGDSTYTFVGWSDGGAASHAIATPAANATYTATFTATGPANQAPTVSLTAPAAGANLVINTATTLTANATDPDGSVTRVEFFDGATPIGGPDATAPYAVSWTPTTLGVHSLTARATDNSLATTTSTAVSVTVISGGGGDVIPPTAQLTAPGDGTQNLTGAITLQATATDNIGVAQVEFEVDGESIGNDNSAPYQFTLPATTPYTTGVHVFRARARDAAGNTSAWSSVRVTFGGNVNLPSGFSRSILVQGLGDVGTAMTFTPDGRLLISQQNGAVRVVKNGTLLSRPLVTLNASSIGETGLQGIICDPLFPASPYVYVYYTSPDNGAHNRISRFTVVDDTVATGSEFILADLPFLSGLTNHNGGALGFGPDGKLYVSVGERYVPDDAQNVDLPFGKILRFNKDGTIPADNPFYAQNTDVAKAVWAYGFRNPFTFAFQGSTGRLFINDVGEASWEEVNEGFVGGNYGWPLTEGATTDPRFRSPIFSYGHAANASLVTGLAVVGADFYEPATALFGAAYVGNYFFADYVNGWINRLDPANGNAVYAFARNVSGAITNLAVGPDGALYVLADVGGTWGVYRYVK